VLSEPEKAKTSAVAQANPFRPRYALVVVSLADELKPDTVREATSTCSGWATRGGRGQRASTDQPRNLRDPTRRDLSRAWGGRNRRRKSLTAVGRGRESEGAIVVWKRGNSRGAKGPCRIDAFVRGEEYRLGQPDYGTTLRTEMEAGTLAKWADHEPDAHFWEWMPARACLCLR
jgi:hypothetical protein